MRLGEILVGRRLVTIAEIEAATERQREHGGRLGESLIAMGLITKEQLDSVIHDTPETPRTVADTGIPQAQLLNLMLKLMFQFSLETIAQIGDAMKLSTQIVQTLIEEATQKKLIQSAGSITVGIVTQIRYGLSDRGRTTALEAFDQNRYVGPAPVPLEKFQDQVLIQRITNEVLDKEALYKAFDGLTVPEHFLRKIGPAINAGRTVLLFGPAGNGKTTIATRVAAMFQQIVYIPYAFSVEGEIIKVFDASIHKRVVSDSDAQTLAAHASVRREDFDQRWVACRRPVVMAGGELTLEMLDLQRSADSKYYEAPLHVKALNGVFLIDDFGRQQVSPEALLNRWIVPMESRYDYLKLHTGKSFRLPFDELLIFSTNLQPDDLMDPAFLRRIPYKIKLFEPSREEYHNIFKIIAKASGLELPDDVFDYVIEELTVRHDYHLAYYQPKFICDQVVAACKYSREPGAFTLERAAEALSNLYVKIAAEAEEKQIALQNAQHSA